MGCRIHGLFHGQKYHEDEGGKDTFSVNPVSSSFVKEGKREKCSRKGVDGTARTGTEGILAKK